jgi:hypothetical protein
MVFQWNAGVQYRTTGEQRCSSLWRVIGFEETVFERSAAINDTTLAGLTSRVLLWFGCAGFHMIVTIQ